ncbi:MAG: serine/threonine-protein phosphatase [Hyphomicrobiales bacterium]|nr:serine/threonine-protein phosphatase [Hyphomicrobiales bacterium]MBV8824598.1 serine/threonine-protein phosphatase [Hyphomicrobiales bacterium]
MAWLTDRLREKQAPSKSAGPPATATPTTQPAQRLRFDAAVLTDVGIVRDHNEDTVLYVPPQENGATGNRATLALVADGMGGHAAGEVASGIAADTIRRVFYEADGPPPKALRSAFAAANDEILNWTKTHPECAGMGTTCTALALSETEAWLAHVGDSRAYLLRAGSLAQLSEDQTLVAQLVREGKLTEEEARHSPVSNVILQALGMGPDIEPVIWEKPLGLAPGDTLIVCTDGLTGLVSDPEIAEIAGRLAPHEAGTALIAAANDAGGHDNISVGIIRAAAQAEQTSEPGNTTRRMALLEPVDEGSSSDRHTRRITLPSGDALRDG